MWSHSSAYVIKIDIKLKSSKSEQFFTKSAEEVDGRCY